MHDLLIENSNVFDIKTGDFTTCNIYIKNSLISKITEQDQTKEPTYKSIDAKNCLLLPGIVDLYNNSNDNKAFAASGLVYRNTGPNFVSKEELIIPTKFQAPLTQNLNGENLAPLASALAINYSGVSNGEHPIIDTKLILNCYHYAASLDLKVFIHCNDPFLSLDGVVNEGQISARYGLNGIPEISESIDIARNLDLIRYTGVKAHFHKISTKKTVELIRQAKAEGLNITADVSVNNLLYLDEDLINFDSNFHVTPPLRGLDSQAALIAGLNDGTIDAICSDHCPIATIHKTAPFALTKPGISNIETFLPLLINLFTRKNISMAKLINAIAVNPAKILNLSRDFCELSTGSNANFCLFTPQITWEVNQNSLNSYGKNTPLLNSKLTGKVQATIVNGEILLLDKLLHSFI